MFVPKAFPLICVCMPYSPFQRCETWLMFQELFIHMCLTLTTDEETFLSETSPELGVVVSNSRQGIWEALATC